MLNLKTHMGRTRAIRQGTIMALMLGFFFGGSACQRGYTPKPAGYLRVDLPEKAYERVEDPALQYSFELPVYARLEKHPDQIGRPGWADIVFPGFNGRIHLSYKPVEGNLEAYIADSRALAYKHTVKAESIEESPFIDRENHRFGMVYDLSGNVASALQFFVTDSSQHFLRGSLYFNSLPNQDSLKPVVDFLRKDVMHLIATTRWKVE